MKKERSRNYRKEQESVHFKRRLKIATNKFHRFVDDGSGNIVPNYWNKKDCIVPKVTNDYIDEKLKWANKRRWLYQLKNGSLSPGPERYKRYTNRKHRHFAKLVDYGVPERRWLVRASISKGDPLNEFELEWRTYDTTLLWE